MIQINLGSSEPIYEQIIRQYKHLVLKGYLKGGDAIPSVRKLALSLSVTPGTVAKAYQELERMGVIQTVRGKGAFIAEVVERKADEMEIEKQKEELGKICVELMYLGLKREDVLNFIDEFCQNFKKEESK